MTLLGIKNPTWMGNFTTPFVALHNDTDLKAYYKFNESSGALVNLSESAADLGTAADGTVTGATRDVAGVLGTGYSFDGVDDHVELGTSLSQWNFLHNGGKSTINIWVKLASIEPGVQYGIIGNNAAGGGNIGMSLWFGDDAGQSQDHTIRFTISNGTVFIINSTTTASFFPKNTNYHMVTMTYDGSLGSNQLKLFMDGGNKEQFSNTAAESVSNATFALDLATLGNSVLDGVWPGIDECSIWNSILTDAQISDLYNNGKGRRIY